MELLCGKCGNTLNVVWDQAGESVRCPHCGNTIRIPAMDDSGLTHDEGDPGGQGESDFLTKARLLLQRKLLVICGSCGERLTVEQRLAGRTLRCPACGEQIRIPDQTDEDDFPEIQTRMDVLDITEEPEPSPTESEAAPSAESDKDRGRSRWPVAIVLVVMTGLAGIAIGYILRGGGRKAPDEKPPATAPARPKPAPTTKPTVKIPPVVATIMPVTPKPKPKAVLRVRQAKTAILADGVVPAPLGRMFLYVKVEVIAGEDALSVNVTGGDVVLESESSKIVPLGLAATGSVVPMVARGGMIVVKPSAGRIETFVFVVPEDLAAGTLKIAGIGEARLPALPAVAMPDQSAIVGTYVEAGRYLRLAFENPIMESLRTGGVHGLVIRKQGERLEIAVCRLDRAQRRPTSTHSGKGGPVGPAYRLSPTGLRGMVHSAEAGTCAAMLTDGKTRLQCNLRLIDSGKRLILYLSEKPYHQIIYKKK